MEGPAAKIVQRRVYSWLSSGRCLPLCLIGTLLVVVSAFQFGEVLLEWSKERYAAKFSIYHDNIAGKSFEKYLCPELPIDIVYTWVNGSDPKLLAELRALKDELAEKKRKEEETEEDTTVGNSSDSAAGPAQPYNSCPFSHCVPWRTILLDAVNMTLPSSLSSLMSYFPELEEASDVIYLNTSGGYVTPVYAIRMPSEDHVTKYLTTGMMKTIDGRNVSVTRGHVTSDGSLVGVVSLSDFLLVEWPALQPGNLTTTHQLIKFLNSSVAIKEVDVPVKGMALLRAKDGAWEEFKNKSFKVFNQTMTFHQAYAVWMPFSLPDTKDDALNVGGDIISQNRFQDNEELRYSLRSVERHAPWIRNIYIVTNGQIPHWINLDNPRIFIVTHEEIFLNQSHLPTYASPAIESHLHRIPGLSKWFLYLNDDVMFGQDVWPDDFFIPRSGQKVYLSWQVPNCADGCPSNWIADRYCDVACNVSKCDWDGGDCANASRPGPVQGYQSSWSSYSATTSEYCNSGCLNSWVGDKYCDTSCRVPVCGYDAGDCGVDHFPELYSITLTEESPPNQTFVIPLETPAMYFNLSAIFSNGTVRAADYNSSSIIRTAVVAQEHKTLSLTFKRNTSLTACAFSVTGTPGTAANSSSVYFTIIVDTMTVNLTKLQGKENEQWNFPVFNDTNSHQFLVEVVSRFGDVKSSKYWISQRDTPSVLPPSSIYPNYTITNLSVLPHPIAKQLEELKQQREDGELTERGFLKHQAVLLNPYKHLLSVGQLSDKVPVAAGAHQEMETHSRHLELLRDSVEKGRTGLRQLMAAESSVLSNDQSHTAEFKPHPPEPAWESRRRFPWERYRVFPEARQETNLFYTSPQKGRKLFDAFSGSLVFVNKMFNRAYGYVPRRVPAHMPHMVNKEILEDLHERYPVEFDMTSSHKLRSEEDMQFAFSYFYFMMSEKIESNASAAFDEFDVDGSGILSVRELRTLLAQLFDIPITLSKIEELEKILEDCSRTYNGTPPDVDPIEFETFYDPDLPLVTRDFVLNCTVLVKKINSVFGTRNKYRYQEVGEDEIAFKMLNENSSKILEHLDWLRKNRRKFICLNDDIDHTKEDSKLSRILMQDFYESMFAIPSQFELPPNYRNKFFYVKDLNEWIDSKNRIQLLLHLALALLLTICLVSLFYSKLLQIKRKLVRWIQGCCHRYRRATSIP